MTGLVGYGWQNSFGGEIKIVGESRVFRDLIWGRDVSNVEEIIRVLTGITYSMNTVDLWGVEMASVGSDRKEKWFASLSDAGRCKRSRLGIR